MMIIFNVEYFIQFPNFISKIFKILKIIKNSLKNNFFKLGFLTIFVLAIMPKNNLKDK